MATFPLTDSAPAWAALACALVLMAVALAWFLARRGPSRSPDPAANPESGFGAYRLGAKIGEGGMGVVFRAEHATLGRPCAVKVLSPSRTQRTDRERFEREARLTRRLEHANIVAVYDSGSTQDGQPYYAMEYVEGQDLQALVDAEGPLPAARVAHLLRQLASALGEAHDAGLVHRDVKPANVMVAESDGRADQVKLVDFGLVKAMGQGRELDEQDEHFIVGTPLYLAPEAIVSPETQDARSDLYAIGAVGYFLLTGTAPFTGNTLVEVCSHHLHAAVVPPSLRSSASIPAELERLLLACLEKAPEKRPHDAKAIAAALAPLAACWTPGSKCKDHSEAPRSDVYRRHDLLPSSGVTLAANAA